MRERKTAEADPIAYVEAYSSYKRALNRVAATLPDKPL
jgi:hypothetical protein